MLNILSHPTISYSKLHFVLESAYFFNEKTSVNPKIFDLRSSDQIVPKVGIDQIPVLCYVVCRGKATRQTQLFKPASVKPGADDGFALCQSVKVGNSACVVIKVIPQSVPVGDITNHQDAVWFHPRMDATNHSNYVALVDVLYPCIPEHFRKAVLWKLCVTHVTGVDGNPGQVSCGKPFGQLWTYIYRMYLVYKDAICL
jgi:hypothetical protein